MPAEARDDDRDASQYVRGPGRRKRPAPGPVIDLYADGTIEIACPDCHVDAHEFCRHPNGALRKIPCGGRKPQRMTTHDDDQDAQLTAPQHQPRRAATFALIAEINELRAAIHRLVAPSPSYINNTYIEASGLYVQLRDAVLGEQSNAGGGGGGKSRPPFWTDAADQLNNIDLMVGVWPTGRAGSTIAQLRALGAKDWQPEQIRQVRTLAGIINAWAEDIIRLLNYEHVRYIPAQNGDRGFAACPACGQTHVERRDSAGERISSPALQLKPDTGCSCQSCGHFWAPNKFIDLAKELGRLPAGVLE